MLSVSYAECQLCLVSVMMSVSYAGVMFIIVMLTVVKLNTKALPRHCLQ
jgi:hypothetical protein